ncbi:MAG: ABC-2 transporter permease [Syntrophomonadaceae bacterium]|nr:ABC-2 transporter permease [Syntrophomonadaceae bacterium]
MNGVDVGIVLIMVAVTLAIVIPMNLKFGNQAARVTTVMFFMLLFFAPVGVKGYIMDNSQTEWAQALINIAVSQPVVLLAAGAGGGILLLGLSMFVSLRIYEAIDF